jgi:signal transduction histidine kinase/HAMP domain-containing protein
MAVSYARAAHTDFTDMQIAELRLEQASPAEQKMHLEEIGEMTASFQADLKVANERASSDDEQRLISEIFPLVRRWQVARTTSDRQLRERLDQRIEEKFDMLIELIADHSFVARRKTLSNVSYYKYASIVATVLALLFAVAITLFLRSRIVRPLSSAAAIADRIAKGELQTPIPAGGQDETGALLRSMTVMQDNIRERMARETALRRSAESRLLEALDTSSEGVILVAEDGGLVLANGTLRGFFPAISSSLVAGVHFEAVQQLISGQLATPQAWTPRMASAPVELELADGRWLRASGSKTAEGDTIILLSDITAIKEREEKLRRATEVAESANAAKSRFLTNMSHELRTPLNAIIGFSEIIAGQIFGAVGNARYLDYSQDILRSGRHLLAVINDVLDLSKNEAGKMQIHTRPVMVAEVLADCVVMVREQCRRADLSLRLGNLDGGEIMGDAAKLRQIFLNLLSNAIKFTEAGGTVSLETVCEMNMVMVRVSDTGIGMRAEDIEVAFQPFRQVDNRLERRFEGTGLGLPLTKALVELHGGTLKLESAPGLGTRCTVCFAAAEPGQEVPLSAAG